MGGAQAGEVASRIAAEAFEPAERGGEAPEAFLRAIAAGRQRARSTSSPQHDATRSGMGTTLTAALVDGRRGGIAHVGDSRAYVFRDGELRLLTSDHSLVEELRRQGRLTDEQAEEHPQRSIITRALGPEPEVEVDTMTYSARPGRRLPALLRRADDDDQGGADRARSSERRALDEATEQLVREANEAGGRDNITVVAFRLEEAGEAAADREADPGRPDAAEEAGLSAASGSAPPPSAERSAAPPRPAGAARAAAGRTRRQC